MRALKLAAGALTLAVLLAACGPAAGPAPTPFPTPSAAPTHTPMTDEAVFAGLMAEVEARNRGIDAPSGDLERFKYDFEEGGPLLTAKEWEERYLRAPEQSPAVLSREDAGAEADYLFRLLRTYYGLYTWFGGDDAFGAAEEEVLAGLEGRGEIPLEEYRELLLQSLDFINDGHFVLSASRLVKRLTLYCDESLLFERRDGGVYLEGRRLAAVDGGDPAEYLKRAVGPEGELTWKLYVPGPDDTSRSAVLAFSDGTETVELPRVKDTDYSIGKGSGPFLMEERNGRLYIQMDRMAFSPEDGVSQALLIPGDEKAKADFITSAETAMGYSTAVVNLVRNPGGNGDLPIQWFRALTGAEPEPNYCTLGLDPFGWGARGGEVEEGSYRVRRPEPQYLEREDGPFLIVLTSGATASAGEGFTDLTHNLSRTLVVGSNTGGCLTGSQTWFDEHLPWSGLELAWGMDLFYWPADYFREGAGLEPDVYLTGIDQGRRLVKFLDRYLPEN